MDVKKLLETMVRKGISDIHFKADTPPVIRVNGRLSSTGFNKFTPQLIHELAHTLMTKEQKELFESEKEIDFAYALDKVSRFRVNAYRQRGTVALSLRVVPLEVRSFEQLHLPVETLKKLCEQKRGMILIAGITGSGKTTTMNAMIDYINNHFNLSIVTVEDPIEFYHTDVKSSISQREVGTDTHSFSRALKHSLRQDPDVVVIGEMRDAEAIAAGVTAAETGHLVISTIHTMDAAHTVERVVFSYPPHEQSAVRARMANILRGILAQRLVEASDGKGRYPASEILIATSLTKKLLAEGKVQELYKAMEQGDYYGMHTFDQTLLRLHNEGKISLEITTEAASNPDDLMLKIRGIGIEPGSGHAR